MDKKLYRSATNKKISGVCAGIAEYLEIDATIIRLVWLLFTFWGPGIIAYIAAILIIPENPLDGGTPPPPSDGNYN